MDEMASSAKPSSTQQKEAAAKLRPIKSNILRDTKHAAKASAIIKNFGAYLYRIGADRNGAVVCPFKSAEDYDKFSKRERKYHNKRISEHKRELSSAAASINIMKMDWGDFKFILQKKGWSFWFKTGKLCKASILGDYGMVVESEIMLRKLFIKNNNSKTEKYIISNRDVDLVRRERSRFVFCGDSNALRCGNDFEHPLHATVNLAVVGSSMESQEESSIKFRLQQYVMTNGAWLTFSNTTVVIMTGANDLVTGVGAHNPKRTTTCAEKFMMEVLLNSGGLPTIVCSVFVQDQQLIRHAELLSLGYKNAVNKFNRKTTGSLAYFFDIKNIAQSHQVPVMEDKKHFSILFRKAMNEQLSDYIFYALDDLL